MYSIASHGEMIADSVRMNAYLKALRHAVKQNAVVVDIGAGTGIFSLLACQFGARKVYALEPDDCIQVARGIAIANGYDKRIEFIQDLSTQVTVPERADVVISDLRGVLPLFQHHLVSVADARRRFLSPEGVLIPACDTLWAAIVEAPELYEPLVEPWEKNGYGLDMRAPAHIVTNTWRKGRFTPEQLLVKPRLWATLDYYKVESPNVRGEINWTVKRSGTAHGLVVWFDTVLGEGAGFSNQPGKPELIYGSAFFPWSRPVTLAVEETISVDIQANLVGEDYVWRWDTRVLDKGDSGCVKADFRQSTFWGAPLSRQRLRKRAADHVAKLSEEGVIDQRILALIDGRNTLEAIARQVRAQFPDQFRHWRDALTRVAEVSQQYDR